MSIFFDLRCGREEEDGHNEVDLLVNKILDADEDVKSVDIQKQ